MSKFFSFPPLIIIPSLFYVFLPPAHHMSNNPNKAAHYQTISHKLEVSLITQHLTNTGIEIILLYCKGSDTITVHSPTRKCWLAQPESIWQGKVITVTKFICKIIKIVAWNKSRNVTITYTKTQLQKQLNTKLFHLLLASFLGFKLFSNYLNPDFSLKFFSLYTN